MPQSRRISQPRLWIGGFLVALATAGCTPEKPTTSTLGGSGPYFHNAAGSGVTVEIYGTVTVGLNCAVVAEDPGAYLAPEHFVNARDVHLEPDQNVRVSQQASDGECGAVRVTTAQGPKIIFWINDELGDPWAPAAGPGITGAAIVIADAMGGVTADSGLGLVHDFAEFVPAAGERVCADLRDEARVPDQLDPQGWWQLSDLGTSPDGCRRLHLARGAIGTPGQETSQWDLCVDTEDFVFEAGDALEFQSEFDSLRITAVAGDDPAFAQPKAIFYRGRAVSDLLPVRDLTATSVDDGCVPQRTEACGSVRVPRGLALSLQPDVGLATLTPESPEIEYVDAQDTQWRIRMERNDAYPVRDRACIPAFSGEADVGVLITGRLSRPSGRE